jgi:hypothetical protein
VPVSTLPDWLAEVVMGLFNLFKRKKGSKSGYEHLNDACNAAFESAFHKCRLDFGREFVEMMDMKSKLLDFLKSAKTTAAQELIAKKLLELIPVYFRITEAYVSARKSNQQGEAHTQALSEIDERMRRAYSLINDLNARFYLCTDELSGTSAYDEIINEAEALRNVISKSSRRQKHGHF